MEIFTGITNAAEFPPDDEPAGAVGGNIALTLSITLKILSASKFALDKTVRFILNTFVKDDLRIWMDLNCLKLTGKKMIVGHVSDKLDIFFELFELKN